MEQFILHILSRRASKYFFIKVSLIVPTKRMFTEKIFEQLVRNYTSYLKLHYLFNGEIIWI